MAVDYAAFNKFFEISVNFLTNLSKWTILYVGMDKKALIQKVAPAILIGGFFIFALDHHVGFTSNAVTSGISKEEKSSEGLLLQIYQEVAELGYRENENFIKREFNFDLDGRSDNREEHILVLSHKDGDCEKMILQLTFFNKISSSFVRHAEEVKKITCMVDGESVEIKEFGFCKGEVKLLSKILKGIRHEKKLFKLIQEK